MDYPLNRNVNLTFIIPTHLPHPFRTILSSSNGTLLLSWDFNSGIKPVEQIPRREWTMVSRDKDNFVVFRSLTNVSHPSLAIPQSLLVFTMHNPWCSPDNPVLNYKRHEAFACLSFKKSIKTRSSDICPIFSQIRTPLPRYM